MKQWLKSVFNWQKWPGTKRGYQSEIDQFLQAFNESREEESSSRRLEREKALEIARRRDTVVESARKKIWEGF